MHSLIIVIDNIPKCYPSNRIKSNDSKRSQGSNKNEAIVNTNDLTQFFEHRISKNEQYRKNQPRKKLNSFLQKNDINYATPKIYSNNIIKNKKNATVMLDYNNSHNSINTKQPLNNTVVIDSSYRSNSRKRGTGTQRISWGNHSVVGNPESIPLSQK